jgi:hypothetical protein
MALARLKGLEPVFGIDPDAPVTSLVNIAEKVPAKMPVGTPGARRRKSKEV